MKILSKAICLLILFTGILFACSKNEPCIEESTDIKVNDKEVLINFVDVNNHDMVKDGYADFHVIAQNATTIYTRLVENERNAYIGFKPVISHVPRGENTIKENFKIYWKSKIMAIVQSTFRLDSGQFTSGHKLLYYINTENKVSNRIVESPIKLLVKADRLYREEGQARFCVIFNFPSVKIQPTEAIDYHVEISDFMRQCVKPIQKGLTVTGNPDCTQNVALAIEGIVHNYYDVGGILQEPYDIVYEIVSQQLFGNHAKHILRVTNSGDCYSNKIQACSLDGQQLNLASVVAQNFFGGEYINLTIK